MALPSYYSTGTASVTQGETVVTGASTAWTSPLRAGDLFGIHIGLAVPIASVDSDTQLTLAFPWPGATQSAAAYAVQIIPDVARMQENTRILMQQLADGLWLTPGGTGTLAQRSAYDAREQGFIYMQTDVSPFIVYIKKSSTSGDWSDGTSIVGPEGAQGQQGIQGDAATVAVGTVTTEASGSDATVTNSGTSGAAVLDFGIPKGDKGDTGNAFTINAVGVLSDRGNYDSEPEGFTFVTSDTSELYVRIGASGWSDGVPFALPDIPDSPRSILTFTGDGTTIAFDLGEDYRGLETINLDISVGAALVPHSDYSISSGVVTFADAPPAAAHIEVVITPTTALVSLGATDYNDLSNKPTLGTAAGANTDDFASAAQAVPTGGSVGQALTKSSATNNDVTWSDTGDFVGPSSATDGNLVAFDGATGKLGKDSGKSISSFAVAATEGAWTPSLKGGTSDPTYTATQASGHYVKQGRLVTLTIAIELNTYTAGAGTFYIGNLPFSVAASDFTAGCAQFSFFSTNGTKPTGFQSIAGGIFLHSESSLTDVLRIVGNVDGGTSDILTDIIGGGGSFIIGYGSYFTDD